MLGITAVPKSGSNPQPVSPLVLIIQNYLKCILYFFNNKPSHVNKYVYYMREKREKSHQPKQITV